MEHHIDDVDLISYVRKMPMLYDKGNAGYKNIPGKGQAWERIARKLGPNVTAEQCSRRWTNLRERFAYCKRKSENKWHLMSYMEFMNKHYVPRFQYDAMELVAKEDPLDERSQSPKSSSPSSSLETSYPPQKLAKMEFEYGVAVDEETPDIGTTDKLVTLLEKNIQQMQAMEAADISMAAVNALYGSLEQNYRAVAIEKFLGTLQSLLRLQRSQLPPEDID